MGGRGATSGSGYKTFPDKAGGSHVYEGDGRSQVQFFMNNSNFDELISNMSNGDISAFRYWTTGGFMDGQQYRGWDRMNDHLKGITQRMDDVLDNATLDKGVVVVRRTDAQLVLGKGKTNGTLEDFNKMRGQVVKSVGAMSTGAASQGLTIGGWSPKGVEYRIHIPGGSKGAGMWIGDKRVNGWGPEQREFVVNRDTYFRVGKARYDSVRNVTVVDLHYDGLGIHDYGTSGRLNI